MTQVTHEVVRGDTLSTIARKYGTTVYNIALLNDISPNSNLYIGQVLIIKNKTISGTSPKVRAANPYIVDITGMGLQSNSDNTIFITWSFKTPNTDHYVIEWGYSTVDGRWFNGSNDSLENDIYGHIPKESTYNPPDNAVMVRARVKPISKTYKDKNGNEIYYWNGQWTSWRTYSTKDNPPGIPPVPMVKIDGYEMTVYNTNLDINATHIEYEIVWGDAWHYKTGIAEIRTSHAYYKTTISPSWNHKARARGKRGNIYGKWSEYSNNVQSIPTAPYGIDTLVATSESSVSLSWTKIGSAKTYSIEYTEKESYFDSSNATTVIDGITTTTYVITGLTKGKKYYFRLKCVNDAGSSGWCEPKSIIIGEKPEPPSTWSDRTIAIIGEDVLLSWLHNAVDGSEQEEAVIELNINDNITTHSVFKDSNDKPIDTYTLNTSSYIDGTKIYWRVKTKGILDEFSEWSIQRLIEVYAPPTLAVNILDDQNGEIDTIYNFPFTISGIAGPPSQKPIMYSISIISKDSYVAKTPFGDVQISVDEEIYSRVINSNENLSLKLSANDLDLENGMRYEVIVRVTMETGLSEESSATFTVNWTEIQYSPNAEILLDPNKLTASIRPYCERYEDMYLVVKRQNGKYYRTDIELPGGFTSAVSVDGSKTTDNKQIYRDDADRLFCISEGAKVVPVTDVFLSVYRRTHDGKFVEISKNIEGENDIFITDPHPSLDYARYRIVSTDYKTGSVAYTDINPKSFDEESLVIQWDEKWSEFLVDENNNFEDVSRADSSMLRLPFNISLSESNTPDVSTVNYIGREHPVSYYGTALGVSSSVSVEFDKNDEDTLYNIRRLSVYMGDVYVRMPSGIGYWANVKVNYDRSYDSLVIPVTFNITRVEGGA